MTTCCFRKEATKAALRSRCSPCLSYRCVFITLLLIAYLGVATAWVFVRSSIYSLVWNSVYSAFCVGATIGLVLSNVFFFYFLLMAFVGDTVVIAGVLFVLFESPENIPDIGLDPSVDLETFKIALYAFAGVQVIGSILSAMVIVGVSRAASSQQYDPDYEYGGPKSSSTAIGVQY